MFREEGGCRNIRVLSVGPQTYVVSDDNVFFGSQAPDRVFLLEPLEASAG